MAIKSAAANRRQAFDMVVSPLSGLFRVARRLRWLISFDN